MTSDHNETLTKANLYLYIKGKNENDTTLQTSIQKRIDMRCKV